MTSKSLLIDFNRDAKWVTGYFILYLSVLILTVLLFGPFFTVTNPLHPLVGAAVLIAFGMAGLRASRIFGGHHNFTGKLLLYYSLTFFLQASSWIIWPFITPGRIPTGNAVIALGLGTLIGQAVAALALIISVRAITSRLNAKSWILVLISFSFSLALSLVARSNLRTSEDLFTWSIIWPTLIFLQLAAAMILLSLLGQWYVARPIGIIAFGLIAYNVAAAMNAIFRIANPYPLEIYYVSLSLITATSFYIVALGMSQVRPKFELLRKRV